MISYEEAMRNAVDVNEWQIDYLRHWLAVAREIREAAQWGAIDALPVMPAPDVEPSTSSARIPVPLTTRSGESHGDHTQRIEAHLHIPLPEDAATEVMGALRNCYHCGQRIAPDDAISGWRHVASQQRICAIPGDGDTIVYAWPAAVDAG